MSIIFWIQILLVPVVNHYSVQTNNPNFVYLFKAFYIFEKLIWSLNLMLLDPINSLFVQYWGGAQGAGVARWILPRRPSLLSSNEITIHSTSQQLSGTCQRHQYFISLRILSIIIRYVNDTETSLLT